MAYRYYSLLPGGTVHAANSGDAGSQAELGGLHMTFAARLDILQGAPADDAMVEARWAEAPSFMERAAGQGVTGAQERCGLIFATGGRSVPQNWATAAKWWRKAAEAGMREAQWFLGVCYYYGRGVERDVARANVWFRKSAAQSDPDAVAALQLGVPGKSFAREAIVRFTNAGSSAPRYAASRAFAGEFNERYLKPVLQQYIGMLRESDSAAPHPSLRDSMWVDFMMSFGISAPTKPP
jgi:TPR repeat protein